MIKPKKPEGEMTTETAIDILRYLKKRTSSYDMLCPHRLLPIDYLEQLAGLDSQALDMAIESLGKSVYHLYGLE